jgi:hypothetical protein
VYRLRNEKSGQEKQWERLELSAYSPFLAPSDFHTFGPLKTHLGGKRFADDEEVETELRKWLRQQSKDFYAAGSDAPVKRWDKDMNAGAGYIEKYIYIFQFRISKFLIFISTFDLFTDYPVCMFCDINQCSSLKTNRRFGGTCSLHLQG